MRNLSRLIAGTSIWICVGLVSGCGKTVPRTTANAEPVDVSPLWVEPTDLSSRDLFHGAGGPSLVPDASTPFTLIREDNTGYSPGYDVRGADGRTWSVKVGKEAQPEVVTSRVLWAIGYHQPPVYYVANWQLAGGAATAPEAGRFRADLPDRQNVGEWSLYENEFLHTQPFKGLIVTNVLLNNWDWKTSNNKIYEVTSPDSGRKRLHVMQDLGASLGKTGAPGVIRWLQWRGFGQGTRNDLEGFEQQGFIRRVDGSRVEFDYRGIHGPLLEIVTRDDVAWTARLLSQISDAQWNDAFRAAGYAPDVAARFIAKIKTKIAEGVRLGDA
jgi:hypothetical protein